MKVADKECFGSTGCDAAAEQSVNCAGALSDLYGVTLSITYELTCGASLLHGDDVIAQTASCHEADDSRHRGGCAVAAFTCRRAGALIVVTVVVLV